jgi:hypothetical protein
MDLGKEGMAEMGTGLFCTWDPDEDGVGAVGSSLARFDSGSVSDVLEMLDASLSLFPVVGVSGEWREKEGGTLGF